MLKRFFTNKIIRMSVLLFVLLLLYIFPGYNNYSNIEYVLSHSNYHDIYLLDKNNFVAKTTIMVSSIDKEKLAKDLLTSLTIDSSNKNKIPESFKEVIPKNTKIQKINIDNNSITVSFSNEIKNTDIKEKMIECIVYTLTSINGINKVYLFIDNKEDEYFDEVYSRSMGVNKEYNIFSLHNINSVTVYYDSIINDINYYIPVTKYVNTNDDKIKIIIEEMSSKSSYESNLISYINYETKLINYTFEDDDLKLFFNNEILNNDDKILEEIKNCIDYSIKDTIKVSNIHFYANDKEF